MAVRDEFGRFVSPRCPDPHCGGTLSYEPYNVGDRYVRQHWRCDGISSMLFACGYTVLGPIVNPYPLEEKTP
jgi:hypothetical protein